MEQIERIKLMQLQLGTLQTQIATGKKTQFFKGLGTDVIASERSRANFKSLDAYINNITIADRRIKLMESALKQIEDQAKIVESSISGQTAQGEVELPNMQELSNNVFNFLVNLVNSQDGDRYLFGGSEATNPPLVNTGILDTYTSSQISSWIATTTDTDTLIGNYRSRTALPDATVGYNAVLSSGNGRGVSIRVDERTEIDYTVLGNDSGIRDILVAVDMLKNLTSSIDEVTLDETDDPLTTTVPPGADNSERSDNFFRVLSDIAVMINKGIDKIDQSRFELSQAQAQITNIKTDHQNDQNILLDTIGQTEDVDPAEVALKTNILSTQLEASYRMTVAMRDLSLANFFGF